MAMRLRARVGLAMYWCRPNDPGGVVQCCRKDTIKPRSAEDVPRATTVLDLQLPVRGVKRRRPGVLLRAFKNVPGGDLLSHPVTRAVPSALEGLTSVFGMGTGVAPPLKPPGNSNPKKPWETEAGSVNKPQDRSHPTRLRKVTVLKPSTD